jgi:hypothetical protein
VGWKRFSFVDGALGLDSVRPGKQLAGQQGWDSSCHTECCSSLEQFSSIHNVLSLLLMTSSVLVN